MYMDTICVSVLLFCIICIGFAYIDISLVGCSYLGGA